MSRYGYIGLGAMGSAMAEHLLGTGASLTVFDVDEQAVEAAIGLGATAAASSAEVAAASDIVSICVPAARHIDAVLAGNDGIAEGAHSNLTILIHSTVHPDTMTAAHRTAATWGVEVFDACVAGGTAAAEAGDLVIFAGGMSDMPSAVTELLAIYGSKTIDAGPVGSGAAIKIGFNVMTYAQQLAAKASFGIVAGADGSTEALVEAWRHSGQLGLLTERYLGLLGIPPEHFVGDFRAAMESNASIARKDLELAYDMADDDPPVATAIAAIADTMPSVMGVPDFEPEGA